MYIYHMTYDIFIQLYALRCIICITPRVLFINVRNIAHNGLKVRSVEESLLGWRTQYMFADPNKSVDFGAFLENNASSDPRGR